MSRRHILQVLNAIEWRCLTDRAYAAGDSPAGARVVVIAPWPQGHNFDFFGVITAQRLQRLVRQRAFSASLPELDPMTHSPVEA
jgi:hypothetical protein